MFNTLRNSPDDSSKHAVLLSPSFYIQHNDGGTTMAEIIIRIFLCSIVSIAAVIWALAWLNKRNIRAYKADFSNHEDVYDGDDLLSLSNSRPSS